MIAFSFVCVWECHIPAPFSSFWTAVTVCTSMHCQYNESVYRKEQHASWELIRFRKQVLTLLTLETLKWILPRPTCLCMESRYNICPFDSNHFKLHFNRLFLIRFQKIAFLQHTSRVRHKDCVQIVKIWTFMNCGNFDVDTFVSDVFMSKLDSLLSVTCRHCSVHTVRMESRSNMCLFNRCQFDSNLLLFTPFLTI